MKKDNKYNLEILKVLLIMLVKGLADTNTEYRHLM